MRFSKAAGRYAKSLLDFSIEQNQLETTHTDVLGLLKAINDSKDLELMMHSKVVQEDKKLAIYDTLFAGKISDLTLKFIKLIAKNSRSSIIPGILEAFLFKYKVHKKILSVEVVTAIPLTDDAKSKLMSKIDTENWSNVEFDVKVDPKIIGGIIFRAGGQQLDASIASRLNELKKEFTSNDHVSQL